MPWIDEEMRAAIAERLRDVHGMPDFIVGRINYWPGPKATRENVIENLARSLAEVASRHETGTLTSQPPQRRKRPRSAHDIVRDL